MMSDQMKIEEYKALRAQISTLHADRRAIETQSYIGCAAIFTWMISSASALSGDIRFYGMFLPFAFVSVMFIRWIATHVQAQVIGTYLLEMERQFRETDQSFRGWETYLQKEGFLFMKLLGNTPAALLFLLVIIGTFVVGLHLAETGSSTGAG